MIARILALVSRLLFAREPTPAELRDKFYNGHDEAKKWELISTRATGAKMIEISRHGL